MIHARFNEPTHRHPPPANNVDLDISYTNLQEQNIIETISLQNAEEAFKAACEAKDELRKAAIEESILRFLEGHYPAPSTPVTLPPPPPTAWTRFWGRISPLVFGILFLGGTVNGMVSTYVSIQHLMTQIATLLHLAVAAQAIFNVVATVTACIFAVINFVLFTQFEVQLLKNNLGLHSRKDIEPTLAAHRKQTKVTKMINRYLRERSYRARCKKPLDTVTNLAALFSDDIRNKEIIFKESSAKKWINRIATTLGFIMQGAIVFFGWSVMVAGGTSAAALAAVSPLGWALILFNVSILLGFYISKRLSSPNKQLSEFKKIGGKQNTFVEEHNIHLALFREQEETARLTTGLLNSHLRNKAHQYVLNKKIIELSNPYREQINEQLSQPEPILLRSLALSHDEGEEKHFDSAPSSPRSPSHSRSSSSQMFSSEIHGSEETSLEVTEGGSLLPTLNPIARNTRNANLLFRSESNSDLNHGTGSPFPQRSFTPPVSDSTLTPEPAEITPATLSLGS